MHAAVVLPLRFFIFPILLILSSFCKANSFSDEDRLFPLEDSNPHKISSSADQSEVHQYPPEVVSRRDFLVRALQQRQPKAVLLARHRVLRPYFQPVPKAKAIPGPILLRTPKAIPKVKGGESLLRVQVNAQSTAGLIKRAEQIRRLQLVNGGGDGSGSSNSEDDAGRESEELEMISSEVQQQEEDHVSTPEETTKKGQSLLAKQNRTQQQPAKAFSSAVKPSLAFSLDSDPVQQQQQKGRPTTFGQPQKWAQPNVGVGKGSQVQRKVAKIGQAGGQIPPLNQQQKLQFSYSPSQTVVNQDFTFAADTPGLVCAYGQWWPEGIKGENIPLKGMPVPIYNTPRKQCIPHSPFCGLAFTCVMDVHAADQLGRPVDNWWTKGSDGKQQPPQWQPGTHQAQGQQTAIVHGPAGQRIGQGVGPAAFTGQFGQQNLRIGR